MTQTLEHKVFTAEPVTTDQGIFEAIVSTPSEDREGDVVAPGSFSKTIAAWKSSGKTIPLAWDHGVDPEDIVGWIDPAQMREEKAGLVVGGKVDLESERGRQVWKLLKSGSLGFSFGYLVTDSVERPGGGREIRGVDLFEVSATTTPMNSDTRVLSTKAMNERDCLRKEAREKMLAILTGSPTKSLDDLPLDELRTYSKSLYTDIDTRPPPQIVTFEC